MLFGRSLVIVPRCLGSALIGIHKQFHIAATKIANLIIAGNYAEVGNVLNGPLVRKA